jgi:hypothetical protein
MTDPLDGVDDMIHALGIEPDSGTGMMLGGACLLLLLCLAMFLAVLLLHLAGFTL